MHRPPGALASRSASGPARRKKNHAAPTTSQTRPSSDVNWRRFDSPRPSASTAAAVGQNDGRRRQHAEAPGHVALHLAGKRQRPAERARQRPAQEHQHREHRHAQPQVALVVQREVAIHRVAVRRQVQQQQPAEARREHEAGIADARAHGLRSADARGLGAAAHHGPCQQHQGRGAEHQHERCRRTAERRLRAAPARTRALDQGPRHARQPGGDGPRAQRGGHADERRRCDAGPTARRRSRAASRRPTASPRWPAARASPRSCGRATGTAARRPSTPRWRTTPPCHRHRTATPRAARPAASPRREPGGGAAAIERGGQQQDGVGARGLVARRADGALAPTAARTPAAAGRARLRGRAASARCRAAGPTRSRPSRRPASRKSPRPSRCCSRNASSRRRASITGALKARAAREAACSRVCDSACHDAGGRATGADLHRLSRSGGSANDAAPRHIAGSTGSGRPSTRKPASAYRPSRPSPNAATPWNAGSHAAMAASTARHSSIGAIAPCSPKARLRGRTSAAISITARPGRLSRCRRR